MAFSIMAVSTVAVSIMAFSIMAVEYEEFVTFQAQKREVEYVGFTTFGALKQDGVLTITFDYPPVNILGSKMLDDLNSLASKLEKDNDVKVVVFQSSHPDIFIAHEDAREDIPTISKKLRETLYRISNLPQATIAKVGGMARGAGLEFALACDMRYAVRGRAVFQLMEVGLGMIPFGGATTRLTHLIGTGRALELMLGAHDFDADLAALFGVINRALDADEIGPYVEELANRIAKFPGLSIKAVKNAVYGAIGRTIGQGLEVESGRLKEATSDGNAQKRLKIVKELQFDLETQKTWDKGVMDLQN